MFELGETAAQEHQRIADMAAQMHFDEVFLVGKNFDGTTTTLPTFDSYESLADYLKEHPLEKSTLLIKGSRGMALQRLLDVV